MKEKFLVISLRSSPICIVLYLCLFFLEQPARAQEYGYYECTPSATYVWINGKLKEDAAARKMEINFQQRSDDEGILATGTKAPFGQLTLTIVSKLEQGHDLVASISSNNERGMSVTTIRIRPIDNVHSNFILLNDSYDGTIFSGRCQYSGAP